jgi:hypothetical protein
LQCVAEADLNGDRRDPLSRAQPLQAVQHGRNNNQRRAAQLGKQTTTSVVKSIFLVIVLDGLFAVFFASIGM